MEVIEEEREERMIKKVEGIIKEKNGKMIVIKNGMVIIERIMIGIRGIIMIGIRRRIMIGIRRRMNGNQVVNGKLKQNHKHQY